MRLDITEVLREAGNSLPYDIHEPPLVDEHVECTRPIEGRVTFSNTGGTLIVRGKANTQVALPCSRCDQYFEQPVDLNIDEQFELKHVTSGPRMLQTVAIIEEDESPVAERLFEGSLFKLTEMLRQYILLDEPTCPLPPQLPDGRCGHCKKRREEVLQVVLDSAVEQTPINPALARLGELLNPSDKEKD